MKVIIDKDEYDNKSDYYRDLKYVNNWKYILFGYLPKDFEVKS